MHCYTQTYIQYNMPQNVPLHIKLFKVRIFTSKIRFNNKLENRMLLAYSTVKYYHRHILQANRI